MPAVKHKDDTKARARVIYRKLEKRYPAAECALKHRNAWELLVATILSAQCTDVRVNMVTPVLFARYPDAASLAAAGQADVETIVRSTGFFRSKARSIIATAKDVTNRYGGQVPRTMVDLLTLRGVARKTANVVLGNAFGLNEGVVVDTHVKRLAHRMALTKQTDPRKVEQDMIPLFPRENWSTLSHLLIWHGRDTCVARKPACERCVVSGECPRVGVTKTQNPELGTRNR